MPLYLEKASSTMPLQSCFSGKHLATIVYSCGSRLSQHPCVFFLHSSLRSLSSKSVSQDFSFGTFLEILLEFSASFAGSFAVGVTIGLISSLVLNRPRFLNQCTARIRSSLFHMLSFTTLQLFKYTQFDKYHTLELVLLVLYSYASYLLADGLGLSGTFC